MTSSPQPAASSLAHRTWQTPFGAPEAASSAQLVPFPTHRTSWGFAHFTRPPGLESRVFLRDRAKPFPFAHLALAKGLRCVYLLLQWPACLCLCLQQHLAAHDHTAEELRAASQMPSTLYVAFPCFKHLPILSLVAFLLQDPTAPSSGELLFIPCRSVHLIGWC